MMVTSCESGSIRRRRKRRIGKKLRLKKPVSSRAYTRFERIIHAGNCFVRDRLEKIGFSYSCTMNGKVQFLHTAVPKLEKPQR
jgi:hypothetical protein